MDYINVNQQLACEEISIAKASIYHWDAFTNLKIIRSYITPFDSDFANRFLALLEVDKKKAEKVNLKDSEYYQLFLKYRQMNGSNVYSIGSEFKNLIYKEIK